MQIDVQMPAMTDPHSVADVFASGLGDIEDLGGCYRFTLYVKDAGVAIVSARVIVPHEALPSILYLAARRIGLKLVKATGFFSRSVH
jgi:hypothetical protein